MKKIEEMEETATALEKTQDEESRKLLKQTEDRLQEEIKKLQIKSTEMVSFPRIFFTYLWNYIFSTLIVEGW